MITSLREVPAHILSPGSWSGAGLGDTSTTRPEHHQDFATEFYHFQKRSPRPRSQLFFSFCVFGFQKGSPPLTFFLRESGHRKMNGRSAVL